LSFAAAAMALLTKGQFSRLPSLAALILAGAALSPSGHVAAAEPQWLMHPAVFLHAMAISFWVGSLAIFLGKLLQQRLGVIFTRTPASDRVGAAATAPAAANEKNYPSLCTRRGAKAAVPGLHRFSSAIPFLLVVLIGAGVVLAIVQVEKLQASIGRV
jgi:copper transport protein